MLLRFIYFLFFFSLLPLPLGADSNTLMPLENIDEGLQADVAQSDFSFNHQTWDFGTFPKTRMKRHAFVFTNTGNAPLVVLHVDTSCGCTATSYTKEPVQPGKKGRIEVTFDGTQLATGTFRKSVIVYTNSPKNYTRLFVKGETKD